jgi:hypothetical protein
MSYGLGFNLVDCVPPGVVVRVDGGDVDSPPVTAWSADTLLIPQLLTR